MGAKSLQSCPTLCNPMDCNPPGSSVHGILQVRILEWVAMPSSRDLSNPEIKPVSPGAPALSGRFGFFTTSSTWEAPISSIRALIPSQGHGPCDLITSKSSTSKYSHIGRQGFSVIILGKHNLVNSTKVPLETIKIFNKPRRKRLPKIISARNASALASTKNISPNH